MWRMQHTLAVGRKGQIQDRPSSWASRLCSSLSLNVKHIKASGGLQQSDYGWSSTRGKTHKQWNEQHSKEFPDVKKESDILYIHYDVFYVEANPSQGAHTVRPTALFLLGRRIGKWGQNAGLWPLGKLSWCYRMPVSDAMYKQNVLVRHLHCCWKSIPTRANWGVRLHSENSGPNFLGATASICTPCSRANAEIPFSCM